MLSHPQIRTCLLALLSISFVSSEPLFGCDCGRAGPACAYTHTADAIFVGKVVFTNDDGSGTFRQRTLVHFQVEEAFKGLSPDTHDVWVDPGSFTSCYAEYRLGERLLVFGSNAGTMPTDTATMSIASSEAAKSKMLPHQIDPTKPPTIYWAPECSGTRLITPETEKSVAFDIAYLRQFRAGTARPLVTGEVFQDEHFGIFDPPRLAGVKITITGDKFRDSSETDSEGRYSFEDVPPGQYTLTAALAAYTAARRRDGSMDSKLQVSAASCGWADFDMIGTGAIEGQLLDHDGRPAPKVKVTILRLGDDGKPVYYGFRETQSDGKGRYTFEGLPSGDFQVGVNLFHAPDDKTPYQQTTWSESGESTIHLSAGDHKQLVPFNLPPASAVRRLSALVVWPDGRPAKGVFVWAEVGDKPAAYGETDKEGRTQIDVLQGINYNVEAKIWVGTPPNKEVARSGALHLVPGADPIQVTLRLTDHSIRYD
jgi:5-hydroxyisourate hydrolase-like protein (transthyretin family)